MEDQSLSTSEGGLETDVASNPSSAPSATSSDANKGNVASNNVGYSIPGILHFLQHEWSRLEMERAQWEVERAELQARIAFLQGERKGQENLKQDLVRRIKMLEFALKQERIKFAKINKPDVGVDQQQNDEQNEERDSESVPGAEGSDQFVAVSNTNLKQGKQLLREYLSEVGYADNVIDIRSNRLRSIIGLKEESDESHSAASLVVNGDDSFVNKKATARTNNAHNMDNSQVGQGNNARVPVARIHPQGAGEEPQQAMKENEAAVLANFDFLSSEGEDDDGDEDSDGHRKVTTNLDKDTEDVMNEFNFLNTSDTVDSRNQTTTVTTTTNNNNSQELSDSEASELSMLWSDDPEEMSRLSRLCRSKSGGHFKGSASSRAFFGAGTTSTVSRSPANAASRPTSTPGEVYDFEASSSNSKLCNTSSSRGLSSNLIAATGNANLELGELEQLTISNDNDSLYDVSAPKDAFRKTWSSKYTLRSHFDGIRALAFHHKEPVLITASDDSTVKMWNLNKTVPAKKSASLDVEPIYTFRGHKGPVLCVALTRHGNTVKSSNQDSNQENEPQQLLYSGGLDGNILVWRLPHVQNSDPYDSYDHKVLMATLSSHSDAVWSLAYHSKHRLLVSGSADGSVVVWNALHHSIFKTLVPKCEQTQSSDTYQDLKRPTCVHWVNEESAESEANVRVAVAFTDGSCMLYDVEAGAVALELDTNETTASETESSIDCSRSLITRVISHPTLPIIVTAHVDRQIKFFDAHTGQRTHSMVAHLDVVTSLSIDANGLYLISGSHDCSLRVWNLETKTCVQEITAHRKKFGESIFDVAFHPSKPFLASAGADALAKVLV